MCVCVFLLPLVFWLWQQLDDLVANKKDLEEVLLFKSTATLRLDEDSAVEATSSKKSHKIEVRTARRKLPETLL